MKMRLRRRPSAGERRKKDQGQVGEKLDIPGEILNGMDGEKKGSAAKRKEKMKNEITRKWEGGEKKERAEKRRTRKNRRKKRGSRLGCGMQRCVPHLIVAQE